VIDQAEKLRQLARGIPAPDSRLDDNRSFADGSTEAGTWTFALQFYGATRVAVYRGPLGNDSAV
jgi:hypothetical protein